MVLGTAWGSSGASNALMLCGNSSGFIPVVDPWLCEDIVCPALRFVDQCIGILLLPTYKRPTADDHLLLAATYWPPLAGHLRLAYDWPRNSGRLALAFCYWSPATGY